ncbi:hypothetical protein Efla_003554 [Eimeria flavescens]
MLFLPTNAAPSAVGPALLFLSGYVLAAVGLGQSGSSASSSALFPSSLEANPNEGASASASSVLESLQAAVPDFVADQTASPSADSQDGGQRVHSLLSFSSSSPPPGASAPPAAPAGAGMSQEVSQGIRSSYISSHQYGDSVEASGGGSSFVAAGGDQATTADPGEAFSAWNPLQESETNESDALRNERIPKDFVGIPLLDDIEEARGNAAAASTQATSTSIQSGGASQATRQQEARMWTDSENKSANSQNRVQNRHARLPNTGTVSDGSRGISRISRPSGPTLTRGYLPSSVFLPGSSTREGTGTEDEDQDITENKPICQMVVAGVEIDATYVDHRCSGEINVRYSGASGAFAPRRLKVTNNNRKDVTVVFKTVDAEVSLQPTYRSRYSSFLQASGTYGPASFLQGVTEDEGKKATAEYVKDMLKEMRKHVRKYPNAPLDLVVSFQSPLDNPETAGDVTSFMQTKEGSDRILGTCEELMSVLEERKHYTCEVLEVVDMVILQFPSTADLSDGGSVDKLLTKLLLLEGKSILFWELSKEASVQMVPVDQDLPEPVTPLAESAAFVQAKAELKQQCSAEATARSHLFSGNTESPLASRLPRDPELESKLWGLFAAKCVHAWLHGEQGHKDVVVAVVDSGVSNHYDLDANAWRNKNELLDGRDNDGNGFVDDTYGWNFHTNSRIIQDGNGHGTHVAGTIGGVSNSYGVVGCSPLVSIMKVQHFGPSGSGSIGDGVRGIAYALLNGAHIINNSWGGADATQSLQLIIERAGLMRGGLGVLVVNAAGNDGKNNDYHPIYPANFDYGHTICVGSYSSNGMRSSFSNYGARMVTLFAPGEKIYSTYPAPKRYDFLSGTSMATPHVSGVAALIFGVFVKANSQVSAAEVKDIIKATLQPLRSARGYTQWGGAPDALAAVLMARMGGMWCQMQCSDMLIDLGAGQTQVPTLLVRGYQQGVYAAQLQAEVYDSNGRLLGSDKFPFKLRSSSSPDTNYPSDAVAATAFAQYKKSYSNSNPLCDVQLRYTGTLNKNTFSEEENVSSMRIAAIVLGCVAGLLVIAIAGLLLYFHLRKRDQPQGGKKKEAISPTEGEKEGADADTVVIEENSPVNEADHLLEDAP